MAAALAFILAKRSELECSEFFLGSVWLFWFGFLMGAATGADGAAAAGSGAATVISASLGGDGVGAGGGGAA